MLISADIAFPFAYPTPGTAMVTALVGGRSVGPDYLRKSCCCQKRVILNQIGYPRHVRSTPLATELRTFQIDSFAPNSEVAALTQSGLTYRYGTSGPDCWWTSNSGVLAVSKTSSLMPLYRVCFSTQAAARE